jgi:putative endonuclease
MAKNHRQQLGEEGEEIACLMLSEKGYKILARNYRYGRAEIDIICQDKEFIVFVEVKTRETDKYGLPEDAVSTAKINNLALAAAGYLQDEDLNNDCRYDIVSIIKNQFKTDIKHFVDAFWPGLY